MRTPILLACLSTCVVLAPRADAQVLNRAIPEAADVGDLVILEGTNLGATTAVRFRAIVGGFVGTWTTDQPALTVSATRVTARVPQFGFTPPNAVPPGNPYGTVAAVTPAGPTAALRFFYMQGTFTPPNYNEQQTSTLGVGTTQSTGQGRPVVSFDLGGGAPTPGNAAFVMKLENAVANAPAGLLIGFPLQPPFPMIGDGDLVTNLARTFILVPVQVNATGDASVRLSIPGPGPFHVALVNQWALLDQGLPRKLAVSNGLNYAL